MRTSGRWFIFLYIFSYLIIPLLPTSFLLSNSSFHSPFLHISSALPPTCFVILLFCIVLIYLSHHLFLLFASSHSSSSYSYSIFGSSILSLIRRPLNTGILAAIHMRAQNKMKTFLKAVLQICLNFNNLWGPSP